MITSHKQIVPVRDFLLLRMAPKEETHLVTPEGIEIPSKEDNLFIVIGAGPEARKAKFSEGDRVILNQRARSNANGAAFIIGTVTYVMLTIEDVCARVIGSAEDGTAEESN